MDLKLSEKNNKNAFHRLVWMSVCQIRLQFSSVPLSWVTRCQDISNSLFEFQAETIAYPEVVITDSGFNWWIIGGAVLVGLFLLIVLVVILYKCGFFKRKRISDDPTLSGNLQKKEEVDQLLMSDQSKWTTTIYLKTSFIYWNVIVFIYLFNFILVEHLAICLKVLKIVIVFIFVN